MRSALIVIMLVLGLLTWITPANSGTVIAQQNDETRSGQEQVFDSTPPFMPQPGQQGYQQPSGQPGMPQPGIPMPGPGAPPAGGIQLHLLLKGLMILSSQGL